MKNMRIEYLKWICGFVKVQGGKMYIGTWDDGNVIGVNNSKKLLEHFLIRLKMSLGLLEK